MVAIPPNTATDLIAVGCLGLALAIAGLVRLKTPQDVDWRLQYRVGLWLLMWSGGGLVLRMSGFA